MDTATDHSPATGSVGPVRPDIARFTEPLRLKCGAVLDDYREYAVAVFGWLARRGHLDAVLALVGHERANLLAMQGDQAQPATDALGEVAPLFTAGFRLLAAMGWHAGDDAACAAVRLLW